MGAANITVTDQITSSQAEIVKGFTTGEIVVNILPDINDGQASFSINGTAAVGNTLSINEDDADPDGNGTLSYSWQTSSDNSSWSVVGTNATYTVGASEEGKSIKAVISYQDGQGFDEIVTTSAASIPYVDNGQASFSINGTAAVGNTLSINEDSAAVSYTHLTLPTICSV